MNFFRVTRVIQFKSDTFGLVSRLLEKLLFFEMCRFFNVCWDCPRYSLQKWYIWASFQFFSSHQLLIFNLLCYSIYLNEKYSIWISFEFSNKNTLTGPANCKKTTRHHAHLSLRAKSRKTNNAKSRKWPKTSIWAIFGRFLGQISPNCKSFWKIGFIQIEGHI